MPRSCWVAVGVLGGAWAATAGLAGAPGVVVVLVALAVLGAWTARGKRRSTALRIAAIAFGLAAVSIRIVALTSEVPAAPLPEGEGPWHATVVSVATPRDGHQSFVAHVEGSVPLRIAVTGPRYPDVIPGDRVGLAGRFEQPPDGSYGEYLDRIGVAGTLRASTLSRVAAPADPLGLIEGVRRLGGEALARALPEPEAGLAAGILIGLRDRVDRDLATAFTEAGLSHVVAISGWNIAIVASLVGALLARHSRRKRAFVMVAVIAAYVLLAGASPSLLRAALMAGVALLGRETGRPGAAAAALGWACALLVLAEPDVILDPGFQLSAAATAGLIAWATPITGRIERLGGGRLPGWLTENLGVSIAAQIATLPIVLGSFGRLALVAPVANIPVVPLVPPAMAAGVVALIGGALGLAGLPGQIVVLMSLPAWAILALLETIVRLAASLPLASVQLPDDVASMLALGSAGVIVLLTPAGRRTLRRITSSHLRTDPPDGSRMAGVTAPARGVTSGGRTASARSDGAASFGHSRRRLAIILGTAALVGAIPTGTLLASGPDGRLHLRFLDVGQGDAVLVTGPRGSRLLVDGGPDPDRLLVALDSTIPPWDRHLDLIVLTHPHEDHVAGLALLLRRYRVDLVLEPGMLGPGPGYREYQAAIGALRVRTGSVAAGDRFGLDGVRFTVLWPDRGAVPRQPADGGTAVNNVSIVLLGEFAGRRVLLTGDIEQDIDPILLARGVPRVDVLKLAHHGSRTSSTSAFLEAARPTVAVVSAGVDNPYGHPNPDTLGRARALGAHVYRTDLDGTIGVAIDARGVAVDRTGPTRQPRRATGEVRLADATLVTAGCAVPIGPALASTRESASGRERSGAVPGP